jgi:hypothetical protein
VLEAANNQSFDVMMGHGRDYRDPLTNKIFEH